MINLANCRRCGRPLLPGARADTLFCSGACRAAQHRAMRAGDVLPFLPSMSDLISHDDDQQVAEAAARALVAPFGYGTPRSAEETAMQRVEAAEKALQAARREASKVFEAAGKSTSGIFAESAFVPRKTAERWLADAKAEASKPPESEWLREKREKAERGPAPKTRAQIEMAEMRSRGISMPSKIEPEDAAARERAVIERFKAATPEQQAAMICAAAAKGVRFRRNK